MGRKKPDVQTHPSREEKGQWLHWCKRPWRWKLWPKLKEFSQEVITYTALTNTQEVSPPLYATAADSVTHRFTCSPLGLPREYMSCEAWGHMMPCVGPRLSQCAWICVQQLIIQASFLVRQAGPEGSHPYHSSFVSNFENHLSFTFWA